jgi:nucleoside-diphosphate-sugar epimerase
MPSLDKEPQVDTQLQSMPQSKKIIICGHKSFAAQGLAGELRQAGQQVTCFSRGSLSEKDGIVSGPIDQMDSNPGFSGNYDALINYILLKEESVERNIQYLKSVLQFCQKHFVKHLIHISSISVYGTIPTITEHTPIESQSDKKGPYGMLKVSTDLYLEKNLPAGVHLTLVRPGFILGPGMVNPIIGIGIPLPGNQMLVMGNPDRPIPLVSRDLLNKALVRIAVDPPPSSVEVLLLTDSQSPTRRDYLSACSRLLGCGERVRTLPVFLWLAMGGAGEVFLRLVGKTRNHLFSKIRGVCLAQSVDPHLTEARLGINLSFDWQATLRDSLAGQNPAYSIPKPFSFPAESFRAKIITFLGFGRIVKQKHLPSLRTLNFSGTVHAYDLQPFTDTSGIAVKSITETPLQDADLIIVATPGPSHNQAISILGEMKGAVLVEKPLCYSREDLDRWLAFAETRQAPVLACHNYRLKGNVQSMLTYMNRFNPGELQRVDVDFQSPPVSHTAPPWARDERRTRTLLMDFSIHFLDLACMFDAGAWNVVAIHSDRDALGQTRLIEGRIKGSFYPVSFLLKQGFGPQRSQLRYTFQNYSIQLGFFPETVTAAMGNNLAPVLWQEPYAMTKSIVRKIGDRIRRKDSDASHAALYTLALDSDPKNFGPFTVSRLAPFYRLLFDLGDRVYSEVNR